MQFSWSEFLEIRAVLVNRIVYTFVRVKRFSEIRKRRSRIGENTTGVSEVERVFRLLYKEIGGQFIYIKGWSAAGMSA
jgi:hypothetical protein